LSKPEDITYDADRIRVSFYINKELWEQFKSFISDNSEKTVRGKIISESVEEALKFYKDFKSGTYNSIQKIFPFRNSKENHNGIRQAYLDSFFSNLKGKTNTIKMLGISIRDFLRKDGIYHDIFKRALEKKMTLYLILLDPTSDAAKHRMKIEHWGTSIFDHTKTTLFRDLVKVLCDLDEYLVKYKGQLKIRFSMNQMPTYLILTNNHCFIENYHSGNIELLKSDIGVETIIDSFEEGIGRTCIGGFVPYFQYKSDTTFYRLMESHFNNSFRDQYLNRVEDVKGRIIRDLELSSWEEVRNSFQENYLVLYT
jgi:hypothetical protein